MKKFILCIGLFISNFCFSQVSDTIVADSTFLKILGDFNKDFFCSYEEKFFDENRIDTLVAQFIDETIRTSDGSEEYFKKIKEKNSLLFFNNDNLLVIENKSNLKRTFMFLTFIAESGQNGCITKLFETENNGTVYLRYIPQENDTKVIVAIEILTPNFEEKLVFH